MEDFTLPDFSVPPLQDADLSQPSLDFPDPARPDPPVPALLQPAIPADLDRLDTARPDPLLSDLLAPEVPVQLRLPWSDEPEYAEPLAAPVEVALADTPGELDPEGLAGALESPDARQLPANLEYSQEFSTQDGMTHRLRRQATLLLGLEGGVEVRDEPYSH